MQLGMSASSSLATRPALPPSYLSSSHASPQLRVRRAPSAPFAAPAPAPLHIQLQGTPLCPAASVHTPSPAPSFVTRATSSVDPLSAQDGVYRPGKPLIVHTPDEFKSFLDTHSKDQGKLVILEAKSSHCRPCKKFASTYLALAERFKDCVFLEVIGDESTTTRRMMVDMKVKSTPTFFLYRNGELLHSFSGIKNDALKKAILERLKPEETGRDWVEHEDDDDEDEDD